MARAFRDNEGGRFRVEAKTVSVEPPSAKDESTEDKDAGGEALALIVFYAWLCN